MYLQIRKLSVNALLVVKNRGELALIFPGNPTEKCYSRVYISAMPIQQTIHFLHKKTMHFVQTESLHFPFKLIISTWKYRSLQNLF